MAEKGDHGFFSSEHCCLCQRRHMRKLKAGEEMNELLRRPKGRNRCSCWLMTENKMPNKPRVFSVFFEDLLAMGSFWAEGKRWGLCLQGYSMEEGQNLFLTNLFSIYLTHQKFWNRSQICKSNVWLKKICTVKCKAFLIFSVCSPHRKCIDASSVSPVWFTIPIHRKT